MSEVGATAGEWRRLFEAAIRFKQLGPWGWMTIDDYFIVTDPETGERGYCAILGDRGYEFGLSLYLGSDAGVWLQKICGSAFSFDADDDELAFGTRSVDVTFEDRKELDKRDLGLIRELGYTFRGSREWPKFRSYEPGLEPWRLNEWQVRFLAVALEQAIHVGERFRENDELYFEHDQQDEGTGEKRLNRVPQATNTGIVWQDEWLPWHPGRKLYKPYTFTDKTRLDSLKNAMKSNEVWESDFSYADVIVGEKGQRGRYPRLCLWVEQKSARILAARLVETADCREAYVELFIALQEKVKFKPARIVAGSEKAYFALKNCAKALGIPLVMIPHSFALLDAKDNILDELLS